MDSAPSKKPRIGLIQYLTPHRSVPSVWWTAPSRWSITPSRFLILFCGLSLFGIGEGLLIQSQIGNSPWSVLAQGVSLHTPLSIGESTFLISSIVLLLWIPLHEKPGFGTIANIFLIAGALQLTLYLVPAIHRNLVVSIVYVLLGVGVIGIASALYITTGLGPGPRDGLMTALNKLTGIRVGRVRFGLELCALAVGYLLGGTAGIGTLIFALGIGNSVAIGFTILHRLAGTN